MKRSICLVVENTTDIRLINGLSKYYQVEIIARKRSEYTIVPWKLPKNVHTNVISCKRELYPVWVFFALLKKMRKYNAVIVNSEKFAGLALSLIKSITNKPCFCVICTSSIEYLNAKRQKKRVNRIKYGLQYGLTKFATMWNISRYDMSIVLSTHIKGIVSRYAHKKVVVIPVYGVDKRVFRRISNSTKNQLRKRLDLPLNKYIIFISSRIAPEKDIESFFKALASLIEQGNTDIVALNLSGQYVEFNHAAENLGVERYTIGRPAVEPRLLPEFYNAVDLCVQPSLCEGLGFSPLEALACETPTIVSHTGGMKESTVHGIHSLHYKPGDPDDLCKKIEYAYKNREEMICMAKRGALWVKDNYDSSQVFAKFKYVADGICEGKKMQLTMEAPHTSSRKKLKKKKRKLNIGMCVNYLPDKTHHGGVSYQVHEFSNRISEKHDVTIFSMNEPALQHEYDNVKMEISGLKKRKRIVSLILYPLYLRQQNLRQFDILHSHGDDFLFFLLRVPIIRTFYGSAIGELKTATTSKRKIHQFFRYFTEFLSGFYASINISISESTKKYLPFINEVIPCGIDLEKFKPGKKKSKIPSILFVGTIQGRKRGQLLLEIFKNDIKPQIRNAELWIVSSEGVEGVGIRWFGRIPEERLIELYQKAWVFCLPSKYEGFGVPYIEAMACGTPVVSSMNAGAREVINEGKYGIIVDDDKLGESILRLLGNKELREGYVKRGLERAQQFSWERITSEYDEYYSILFNRLEDSRKNQYRSPRN